MKRIIFLIMSLVLLVVLFYFCLEKKLIGNHYYKNLLSVYYGSQTKCDALLCYGDDTFEKIQGADPASFKLCSNVNIGEVLDVCQGKHQNGDAVDKKNLYFEGKVIEPRLILYR